MDNKKKIILSGLAMTLVAGATSGAALAYLTDGETAENTFTIGDVSIEGIEPNYPGNDCDEVKDIVPNDEIDKDPQIDNDGINDAIVFMTVDSPMELVTIVNDNGSHLQEKGVNELFWFKNADDALSVHANNFSQDWQELSAKEMYVKIAADGTETQLNASTSADLLAAYNAKAADEHIVKRYVFGYTEAIQGSSTHDGTPQTPENKVTSALFDKIQLKNVIENEIDESVEKIVVRSYAIQATKILENSVDLAANLNEANLGKIYDIFIRQNSAQNDASGLRVAGLRGADTLTPTSNGASGTTDEHKNRFGTQDDVESENCNLNPDACLNSGETHYDSIFGEWTTTKNGQELKYVFNENDHTFEYYLDAVKVMSGNITNAQDGTITLEVTETTSETPVGTVITLNYEANNNFTEITIEGDDVWERIIPEEEEAPLDIVGIWSDGDNYIEFTKDGRVITDAIHNEVEFGTYEASNDYDTEESNWGIKIATFEFHGETYNVYAGLNDFIVVENPERLTYALEKIIGRDEIDACISSASYYAGTTQGDGEYGLAITCDEENRKIYFTHSFVSLIDNQNRIDGFAVNEPINVNEYGIQTINPLGTNLAAEDQYSAFRVIFDSEDYVDGNEMIFVGRDTEILSYMKNVTLYEDAEHTYPVDMSLSFADLMDSTGILNTYYGHYDNPDSVVTYDSVNGEWYGAGMKFVVDSSASQKITAYEKVDGTWQASSRRITNITLGTNQIKMRLASSSAATLLTFDVNETFDTAESSATGLILTREEPTVDERFIGNWTYSSYRYTFDEDSNYSVTYGGTTDETGTYFTTDSKLVLINSTGKVTSYDYTYVSGTTTRLNLTSGQDGMTFRKSS